MKYVFSFLILFGIGAMLSAQGSPAEAAEVGKNPNISLQGYARASAFFGGTQYDWSVLFSEFSARSELRYKQTMLFADLRFRQGEFLGQKKGVIEAKEAWAGYKGDRLDVMLGNQIVSWGRTDGFNPTDNLNPKDYFFLTSNPDDQLISNFMLRARYRISPVIDFDLVGVPLYAPSLYRYELFEMGDNVQFLETEMPERSFENGTFAGRLNFNLPQAGFSLSLFQGYDPYYGIAVDSIDWSAGYPEIYYAPTPYKKTTAGADFDIPLGSWMVRGEMAWNITSEYENNPYIPNPDLSYVFGLEQSFAGIRFIAQYIGKYTFDYIEPIVPTLLDPTNPLAQMEYASAQINYETWLFDQKIFQQQKETNHAISLVLSRSFAYSVLDMELAGYYNITSEEYLVRPKLTWHVTDALHLAVGGSFMEGPEKTLFDYSGTIMNGVFVELKAGF